MKKKIIKYGNSHAVVMPAAFLESLDLQAGDEVELELSTLTNEIIVRNTKTAPLTQDSRFDRLVKDAVNQYLSDLNIDVTR